MADAHLTGCRPSRIAGLALAMLVAVLLVWRVLVTGSGAMLEGSASGNPKLAQMPVDVQGFVSVWRERLAQNPADAPALLVLALQLEQAGKRDEARSAMREALLLAPSNEQVLIQAANFFLRVGDDARALVILRRLVDLYPAAGAKVWPVFTAVLDSGRNPQFFVAAARDNPLWWPAFFQFACDKSVDPVAVQGAFVARVEARLATADERRCVIGRFQREGRWTTAYQLWVNSLPADQQQRVGYVFNGGFEYPLSNIGFDWLVPGHDGVGVDTQVVEGVTGKRALRVAFANKRFVGPPVYQNLMLFPGAYALEGRGRSDGLDTWLGLQWGLYCQDGTNREWRQLAHSERFLGSSSWTDFRKDFVVPKDCLIQMLRLELANPRRDATLPGSAPTRLRGSIWFDDLRVKSLD